MKVGMDEVVEQSSIPTSKVQRAASFLGAGARVGGNYIKHYAKKAIGSEVSQDDLDRDNAEDIYNSLSELKGSALKVAQMLSMDKNILPKAYSDKFSMAQNSAPPLSYPLVVKTFQRFFGKDPLQLFDTFSKSAVAAASIGQVHLATKDGKKLAVKIQYPGVADSVVSDLKIVRPMATKLLNLKGKDIDVYFKEVESKLLEETDYTLELKRSQELSAACHDLPNLVFPTYYPELSCERVITMDWIEGQTLGEAMKGELSQEMRNKVGQAIWDFYDFQINDLRMAHADPHPGNFIITPEGNIGILDFGCVKEIPQFFYENYFRLLHKQVIEDEAQFLGILNRLDFLLPTDSPKQKAIFTGIFKDMVDLLGKPFHAGEFDFSDNEYFEKIYKMGEETGKMKEVRNANGARGTADGIYINRTYFGLYAMLNQLGAKVVTRTRFVLG